MASRTVIELTDDLDGGEAEETVEFGLDGVTYAIDLSAAHAEELRDALDAYVQKARRTGGRKVLNIHGSKNHAQVPGARNGKENPVDREALTRFAVANGYPAPHDRGRISRELLRQYEDAGSPA